MILNFQYVYIKCQQQHSKFFFHHTVTLILVKFKSNLIIYIFFSFQQLKFSCSTWYSTQYWQPSLVACSPYSTRPWRRQNPSGSSTRRSQEPTRVLVSGLRRQTPTAPSSGTSPATLEMSTSGSKNSMSSPKVCIFIFSFYCFFQFRHI